MSIKIKHNQTEFGVGDKIRVHQIIVDNGKKRDQYFDGIVIAIKNKKDGKSFTVRKIGEQKIGIERIFPLISPTISDVSVLKRGIEGIKQSKLYYIRSKSQKEIEKIYSRAVIRKNKE